MSLHRQPNMIERDDGEEPIRTSYDYTAEFSDVHKVFLNLFDAVFVTDGDGVVIAANPTTNITFGLSEDETVVGMNEQDLVKQKIYDRSMVLEALRTKQTATGLVKTRVGYEMIVTAVPVVDQGGRIVMVVTSARDKNFLANYISAFEREVQRAERYKNLSEYLNSGRYEEDQLIAESPQMRQIVSVAKLVARTDTTVLLLGESGTGKEVMARFLHRNSLLADEPFVPVNCAGIPDHLLESELFGYVRGAFTGANAQGKPGLFEIAHNGTIFLDEIGELPSSMQPKLLRVLETGEVQRLGSTTIKKVSVRIITATNRNLKEMVHKKLFRDDLYYRINTVPIYLPPLRERPEDLVALAEKFLHDCNVKYGSQKRLTKQAMQSFLAYGWPGNVRELRNVIERLVITTQGDDLYFHSGDTSTKKLPNNTPQEPTPETQENLPSKSLKSVLEATEACYIRRMLSACNGRINEAAKRLNIHRTMLYRKMKKYHIEISTG